MSKIIVYLSRVEIILKYSLMMEIFMDNNWKSMNTNLLIPSQKKSKFTVKSCQRVLVDSIRKYSVLGLFQNALYFNFRAEIRKNGTCLNFLFFLFPVISTGIQFKIFSAFLLALSLNTTVESC